MVFQAQHFSGGCFFRFQGETRRSYSPRGSSPLKGGPGVKRGRVGEGF